MKQLKEHSLALFNLFTKRHSPYVAPSRKNNVVGYLQHCKAQAKLKNEMPAIEDSHGTTTVWGEFIHEPYTRAALFHLGMAFAPLLRRTGPTPNGEFLFHDARCVHVARLETKVGITVPSNFVGFAHTNFHGAGFHAYPEGAPPVGVHPVHFLQNVLAHPALKAPNPNEQSPACFVMRSDMLPLMPWRIGEVTFFCDMLRSLAEGPDAMRTLLDDKERFKADNSNRDVLKRWGWELPLRKCAIWVDYSVVRALDNAVKGTSGESARAASDIRDALLQIADRCAFGKPREEVERIFRSVSTAWTLEAKHWIRGSMIVSSNCAQYDEIARRCEDTRHERPPLLRNGVHWKGVVAHALFRSLRGASAHQREARTV
jgi:hypothetical protein